MDKFYIFLLIGIIILVIFSLREKEHFNWDPLGITHAVAAIAAPVVNTVAKVAAPLVNTVANTATTAANAVGNTATTAVNAVGNAAEQAGQTIVTGTEDVVSSAEDLGKDILQDLTNLNPLGAVKDIWNEVQNITVKLEAAGKKVIDLGTKVEEGIAKGAEDLVKQGLKDSAALKTGIESVETKIETGVKDAAKGITDLAQQIPGIAKTVAETAIKPITTGFNDITDFGKDALTGGKDLILSIPDALKDLAEQLDPFFKALKDFFDQLEIFTKIVLILMKRTTNCVLGGGKAMESYLTDCAQKYDNMINTLTNFSSCGNSIWGIYHHCWLPVQPARVASHEFFVSIKTWWRQVLTYPEMRPQGANLDWCNSNFKLFTNTEDSLVYAKKCNECLYLKGIMALGIGELENLGSVLTELLTISMKILEGAFAIGPTLTKGVTDLESTLGTAFSKIPLL